MTEPVTGAEYLARSLAANGTSHVLVVLNGEARPIFVPLAPWDGRSPPRLGPIARRRIARSSAGRATGRSITT
jgi:hypothetical protein